MKTSLLSLTLCLVSMLAFAQEPMKKANTIIIESSDSASIIYKNLKRILLDNDFALAASDNDAMSITATAPVAKSCEMTVDLYVKPGNPNQVIIRGMFEPNTSTTTRSTQASTSSRSNKHRIEYLKVAGEWFKASWKKMDELAKAYPGGQVSYQIKQ